MQNLDELMKNIGLSIRSAQEETEHFSLELYKKWFEEKEDEDGKKTLRPLTITVALPSGKDSYEEKEIPIIALLNHNSLVLNEVKIKMALVSRWDEEENKMIVDVGPVKKSQDSSNKTALSDTCEVDMIFKARESGEGISRYIDKFVRII